MDGLGNLRISNKFLLIVPKHGLTYTNCPRRFRHHHKNQVSQKCSKLKYPSVESKVVIVTGGVKATGYQIADKLLQAKAKAVILADENLEDMENITHRLNEKYRGLKALFQPMDNMKKGDMMKLFKYTKKIFNQLDVVINNVDVKSENQTALNLRNDVIGLIEGTFLGYQEMSRQGGVIINTVNGLPRFNQTSRFVIGFTRNLSHNYFYIPSKVKIMTVCRLLQSEKSAEINIEGVDELTANTMKAKLEDNEKIKYNYEDFGNTILSILNTGKNGSVWIAEPHRIYRIRIDQDLHASPRAKESVNVCPTKKSCNNHHCSNFKNKEPEEKM